MFQTYGFIKICFFKFLKSIVILSCYFYLIQLYKLEKIIIFYNKNMISVKKIHIYRYFMLEFILYTSYINFFITYNNKSMGFTSLIT